MCEVNIQLYLKTSSYVFYVVANSYTFVQPHLFCMISVRSRFRGGVRRPLYEFVRISHLVNCVRITTRLDWDITTQ